jgi:hypothetical protein
MYRLLQNALAKSAKHERIIFADVNLPSDQGALKEVQLHREVASKLIKLERNQRPTDPWPQAIIFFTNRATSHWPNERAARSTILLTAINHPLFKINDASGPARQYPEIGKLFHAAMELADPPIQFFGQPS